MADERAPEIESGESSVGVMVTVGGVVVVTITTDAGDWQAIELPPDKFWPFLAALQKAGFLINRMAAARKEREN